MRKHCKQNFVNVQLPTLPLCWEPAEARTAHSAGLDLPFLTMNSLSGHRHWEFSFRHWPGEHQPGASEQCNKRESDGRMPELRSLVGVKSDSREEWRWVTYENISFTLGPKPPNFLHPAQKRKCARAACSYPSYHSVQQCSQPRLYIRIIWGGFKDPSSQAAPQTNGIRIPGSGTWHPKIFLKLPGGSNVQLSLKTTLFGAHLFMWF